MKPLFDGASYLIAVGLCIACVTGSACSAEQTDANGTRLPSDYQVIADVTPRDDERIVDVKLVAGKSGETYLHENDRVWYFDRGVVVRRKTDIAGFPDAVVAVGGLARYVYTDDGYRYHRFLTTYNAYEGIPAPSNTELTDFVNVHLGKIFLGRAHNVLGIESVSRDSADSINWHSPTSFTTSFAIRYRERRNNTTIEQREGVFDIRFYKQSIDAAVSGLDATERTRTVINSETHDASKIDRMKTLTTNFL